MGQGDYQRASPTPAQLWRDPAPPLWRRGLRPQTSGPASDARTLLCDLGVESQSVLRLEAQARGNGTTVLAEALASGVAGEDALFRAVADRLNLPYATELDPADIHIDTQDALALLRRPHHDVIVRVATPDGTKHLLAPGRLDLHRLGSGPSPAASLRHLAIVRPSQLRRALMDRVKDHVTERARNGFFSASPDMSARLAYWGWQGFLFGSGLLSVVIAMLFAPHATALAGLGLITLVFLGCIALRLAAAGGQSGEEAVIAPFHPRELPRYSVMVALCREAEVVPDLLSALSRLRWPRSKLDVKLVCEADDAETLAAIARHPARSWIEVIAVPPSTPRTKPKALAFALPMLAGDIVAVYDAEDRPHPDQLLEAWNAFRRDDGTLACVQAPLLIANDRYGPLPLMFRLEYAALFEGILPWLARRRLFFSLGGTSNHFRRSVLEQVGAWDPYNVTEDADIAVRLARHGHRCTTITSPTLEDAPEDAFVWSRQRTRWFKGFVQSWLVHMRDPMLLWRQMGLRSFLVFQVMFAGMVGSALAHPILVGTTLSLSAQGVAFGDISHFQRGILLISLANLMLGYGAFLILGWHCLPPNRRRGFWKTVLLTPPYWMLISFAAWRGVLEFVRRPHHWDKTPHQPYRRPPAATAPWRQPRAGQAGPATASRSGEVGA